MLRTGFDRNLGDFLSGATLANLVSHDRRAALGAVRWFAAAHLTRYHGVFAPASPDRPQVVPGTRAAAAKQTKACSEPAVTDRQRSLTWAQRLKRVFAIDIEVCRRCGGRLRVIASIEEQTTRRAPLHRLD